MSDTPVKSAFDAANAEPRKVKSVYPQQFAARMEGRTKRVLGDVFDLKNFGVNHTTLAPDGESALLHKHSSQDEFIYILAGEVVLVTESGEQVMKTGMCAGFPAGGEAHQLVNRSNVDAVILEVGDRSADDTVDYPQDDMKATFTPDGWVFTKKDGSGY
ncbi:cupin domain-containing protein [Kordiimonas sp. SCSIO 12603]|uniref:cupin domain-containing protein n=1 Tax=Kordiimonas sp. SCSIO 12603 TaxID=2829596 RepID=UPI0021063267|nr:cupin domain-containing protein [Kordiimonas sp. SCSIO 12603]UTW59797.1 cupin domain-containing protein [Kordiimonas sp. SCSIO 12603]